MSLFLFFGQFLTAYFKFFMSRPRGSTSLMNFSNTHQRLFTQFSPISYISVLSDDKSITHIWQSCLRFKKSRVNNRITHMDPGTTWSFSPQKSPSFCILVACSGPSFFACLRFSSVVVKRIKNIHLFFLNSLMCFFLWSFKFSRFCQFQYRISIYHHYITTMTRSLNTNHEKGQNWKKKAP